MCSNAEDLREMAEWDGKGQESRTKLMEKLQGNYSYENDNYNSEQIIIK